MKLNKLREQLHFNFPLYSGSSFSVSIARLNAKLECFVYSFCRVSKEASISEFTSLPRAVYSLEVIYLVRDRSEAKNQRDKEFYFRSGSLKQPP